MDKPTRTLGKGKKRKTIKDVAAAANVSISTVSLALNGTGYVSANTRERVIAVAERLGYVAQSAARQLASRKTGNIGFVLRADHFTRSEPFYTHVFLGCEFEADRHDRYVLLASIPESYTPVTDTPRFLRERNVDGIIVAGKVATEFIREVGETGIPMVLVDFEASDYPAVAIDNQSGARDAVRHLIDLGHRSIAFVGADLEHPAISARLDGFRLAMDPTEIPVGSELIVADAERNPDYETGQILGDRLLGLSPRPTAAFCVNDAVAMGVLDAARRAGLSLPEDLSVVGFDDVAGAGNATPALTTVRVFKQQLGELAVRYLDELIDSDVTNSAEQGEVKSRNDADRVRTVRTERRPHDISVPVELVVRDSTGPPPQGGYNA